MSNHAIELKWEWPAGRKVETKLLMRVENIALASKGFLGLGASPSIVAALPEATDVSAQVVLGPEAMLGKKISVRLPGLEARKLKKDQFAAVGLVAGNALAVCVEHVPVQELEPARSWLQQWNCS